MQSHQIPRQITTFEFKLIGFLTLRQFIYLAIFSGLAVVCYYAVPIPILNILAAIIAAAIGLVFAFVPINERPLDVWIKNLFKKLFSASQYYYVKKNQPPSFFKNVLEQSDPDIIQTHILASQKLSFYLSEKTQEPEQDKNESRKQQIHQFILEGAVDNNQNFFKDGHLKKIVKPFFLGVVKNNKNIPLPNLLIYIKNESGQTLRILKTNLQGVFATFHPLPSANYIFEIKDTKNRYFFDKMKIKISSLNQEPFSFKSRELL